MWGLTGHAKGMGVLELVAGGGRTAILGLGPRLYQVPTLLVLDHFLVDQHPYGVTVVPYHSCSWESKYYSCHSGEAHIAGKGIVPSYQLYVND